LPYNAARWGWREILLGITASAFGLVIAEGINHPVYILLVLGSILYFLFAVISLQEPLVFVAFFLATLIAAPPFYFDRLGETPVYVSMILLPVGSAIAMARFPDFRIRLDPIVKGLTIFLAGTALSLPYGWLLSGPEVGAQSLSRWLMLAQTVFVYLLVRGGTRLEATRTERWMFRILLLFAVLSAAYGILDFIWPVPLRHPAADQFIWLQGTILRRAQGVFYEASNYANMCGFFLVAVAATFLAKREHLLGVSSPWLLFAIALFGLAVLVAFSRSTWASIFTSLVVFAVISKRIAVRRSFLFVLGLGLPLGLLWFFSPELWSYLLSARVGYLSQILIDPNLASSGRFDTWLQVLNILRDNPPYLLFGVGYKTLPYTRLFHNKIITDNGYLSLLLETGIVGLGGFLLYSGAILRTFFKLARSTNENLQFWGALLFSFWCGECVLLVTLDAYTFWRNMIVFTAVMALVMNWAEREGWAGPRHRQGFRLPSPQKGTS
jgi:O-antigen ligase